MGDNSALSETGLQPAVGNLYIQRVYNRRSGGRKKGSRSDIAALFFLFSRRAAVLMRHPAYHVATTGCTTTPACFKHLCRVCVLVI